MSLQCNNTTEPCNSIAQLVPFDDWLKSLGHDRSTGYRYRRRGLITTVNIFERPPKKSSALRSVPRRGNLLAKYESSDHKRPLVIPLAEARSKRNSDHRRPGPLGEMVWSELLSRGARKQISVAETLSPGWFV